MWHVGADCLRVSKSGHKIRWATLETMIRPYFEPRFPPAVVYQTVFPLGSVHQCNYSLIHQGACTETTATIASQSFFQPDCLVL